MRDNLSLIRLYTYLLLMSFLRYPSLVYGYATKKKANFESVASTWHKKKERGTEFSLKVVGWLYRLGGTKLLRVLLLPVITYFYLFDSIARGASKNYLAKVSRVRSHDVTIFGHLHSFGQKIVDSISAWCGDFDGSSISWVGRSKVYEYVHSGQGALVISAHVGCLEVCRASSLSSDGLIITPLMYSAHARKFRNFLRELNPQAESSVIAIENFNPAVAIEMSKRIDEGEFVALLADRVAVGSSERTVEVDFFGEKCLFSEDRLHRQWH